MDFNLLEYEDALEMIPDKDAEWFKVNQAFAQGDHWQEGAGWTGPRLDENHPLSAEALGYIERIFVSEDTFNEIIERHADGVAGSEFTWSVVSAAAEGEGGSGAGGSGAGGGGAAGAAGGGTAVTPGGGGDGQADQPLIAEAELLLREWIDTQGAIKALHDAVSSLAWSGRGPLRLYVPAGRRDESGMIPPGELPVSIMRIFVESPDPAQTAVALDPDTKDEIGIYTYTTAEDEDVAELVYIQPESKEDERPLTVLRVTGEGGEMVELDFGGRLTMFEMRQNRLMTNSIVSNQKKLNHAATAEQSNLATAGWIARLILNGQMPGDYKRDQEGNLVLDNSGRPQFVADPMVWGPESVNFIVGVTTTDEDGNERIANPTYVREEPSSPEVFIQTKVETRKFMLSRAKQAYVFLADDGRVSGESRLRARSDFESSLNKTKQELDKAITWLLETALAMAATFSGKPGYFDAVRIMADAQIDIGIVTPEERRVAKEMCEAGLVSKRTALTWIGINDVEGELQQMQLEAAEGIMPTANGTRMNADDADLGDDKGGKDGQQQPTQAATATG